MFDVSRSPGTRDNVLADVHIGPAHSVDLQLAVKAIVQLIPLS